MSGLSIMEAMLASTGYHLEDLRHHAKHDARLVTLRKRVIHALGAAGYSSVVIGELMNRDHTTVLHTLHRPIPR